MGTPEWRDGSRTGADGRLFHLATSQIAAGGLRPAGGLRRRDGGARAQPRAPSSRTIHLKIPWNSTVPSMIQRVLRADRSAETRPRVERPARESKKEEQMTIATHALSEKDATTMRQIRESLKGIKETMTGPQGRPVFDEIMKSVA